MTANGTLWLSPAETDIRKVVAAVRQLMEGRSNATGTATLSSTGATVTTVTAPTCGYSTKVFITAETTLARDANATVATTDITPQQFIIHHSSSTSTSRIFGWAAFG